jgi:hypothetical protein
MTKRARTPRAVQLAAERAAIQVLLTERQIEELSQYAGEPADLPRLLRLAVNMALKNWPKPAKRTADIIVLADVRPARE